ncbi:hypothetical protein D9C73_000082 [Collichthys lucidus]|uniref:Uncharacterized protein n=1 Tax=Collichthys lucidus TaxID=240159 RepID=A0A4U5TWK4_COLLU|nr:hypothetical protein D9C73_000082 [Collichthys lucidus]
MKIRCTKSGRVPAISLNVVALLRKLSRDLSRTVLGHQALVKQEKGKRLVAREDLARCQKLARAKIPSLLEDIEKAAPRDPKTRYRFFGYFAAYLSSIYGHRTGVLTRMRVKEVRAAIGDDEKGYLINVSPGAQDSAQVRHRTDISERGGVRVVPDLDPPPRQDSPDQRVFFFSSLGRGEAKDMARYFRGAWTEMGLKGAPSIMDVRTAVSTLNFVVNRDSEVRANLASFMCHSVDTQDRFYALHRNIQRAQMIRRMFICLAVADPEKELAAAAARAAATTQPREERKGTPSKRAAAINLLAQKVKRKRLVRPREKPEMQGRIGNLAYEMTKTKESQLCPVCGGSFVQLAKRIRNRHAVVNPEERVILNNMATGRVTLPPGPCPMPGCGLRRMHVAKHLKTHHVISRRRLKEELLKLKRAAGIAALAKLRATNPQQPMATTLDLPDPGEGSSTSQRQPCANPSCRALAQHCQGLQEEIQRLGRNEEMQQQQPSSSSSSSSDEETQQQQKPSSSSSSSSDEETQQQQQPSSSSSSSSSDEETQQQQQPATPRQEAKTSSARKRLPFTQGLPQQSSSSFSS